MTNVRMCSHEAIHTVAKHVWSPKSVSFPVSWRDQEKNVLNSPKWGNCLKTNVVFLPERGSEAGEEIDSSYPSDLIATYTNAVPAKTFLVSLFQLLTFSYQDTAIKNGQSSQK